MKNFSIAGVLLFIGVVITSILLWDVLFSTPQHTQGTIVDKIYVPAKIVSRETVGVSKRGKYFVSHAKEEQWIAIVRTNTGDTLKVHCVMDHYNSKNIGDVLHFKKYEGHLVHIEYFAHNEEEN